MVGFYPTRRSQDEETVSQTTHLAPGVRGWDALIRARMTVIQLGFARLSIRMRDGPAGKDRGGWFLSHMQMVRSRSRSARFECAACAPVSIRREFAVFRPLISTRTQFRGAAKWTTGCGGSDSAAASASHPTPFLDKYVLFTGWFCQGCCHGYWQLFSTTTTTTLTIYNSWNMHS